MKTFLGLLRFWGIVIICIGGLVAVSICMMDAMMYLFMVNPQRDWTKYLQSFPDQNKWITPALMFACSLFSIWLFLTSIVNKKQK